jgi:23S rRNA (pseudouridine1915-N3)-methyltransferase
VQHIGGNRIVAYFHVHHGGISPLSAMRKCIMKWKVITVGKPALAYAKAGATEYLSRLQHYTPIEWQAAKSLPTTKVAGDFWLVLDERGELPTTSGWRTTIDQWERRPVKSITVLIGGADGHSAALRDQADSLLSLSRFTLMHELALVVFLEQLYRVYTLKKGEPYHRE